MASRSFRKVAALIIVSSLSLLTAACSSSPSTTSKSYRDGYSAGQANVRNGFGDYANAYQACIQITPLAPAGDDQGQFMSGCQAGWNRAKGG